MLSPRLIHLDMLRGMAALLVVIGHIRSFVLVDFPDLVAPGLIDKFIYFTCGLGHQAVIVFFALSGFLVGGPALSRIRRDDWSFADYMIARLSRLWTVALPALALTISLDIAGRMAGGGAGYEGKFHDLVSAGPSLNSPAVHHVWTLLGNAAFLQTISVPVFGSNGPLWSLANEFWYYVTFPILAGAFWTRKAILPRVLMGAAGVVLIVILPRDLIALGAIWVAGAVAHHLAARPDLRMLFASLTYRLLSFATVATIMVIGFRGTGMARDLSLGLACATVLPALAFASPAGSLYDRCARGLSEISYTLYATHFPLLAAAWFALLAPEQAAPGVRTAAIGGALLAASIALAVVMWWLFERNTPVVRAAARRLFLPSRRARSVA